MRITFDANVLVYALDRAGPRAAAARSLLTQAVDADTFLTNQVLGECLNVVRRKRPEKLEEAARLVAAWSVVFAVEPTATRHLLAAARLSARHKLQFWDALIVVVAGEAGAEVMLTEDLQDRATVNGVLILNPFEPANGELVAALLTPPS